MIKNKIVHIYDATFMRNIYVFYGTDKDFLVNSVKENSGVDYPRPEGLGACSILEPITNGNMGRFIILWTKDRDVSVLCHEAIHAAFFLLDFAGVEIGETNDEPVAYLAQRIVRETLCQK